MTDFDDELRALAKAAARRNPALKSAADTYAGLDALAARRNPRSATCKAKTAAGIPCTAAAKLSGHCLMHATRTEKEELRQRKLAHLKASLEPVKEMRTVRRVVTKWKGPKT